MTMVFIVIIIMCFHYICVAWVLFVALLPLFVPFLFHFTHQYFYDDFAHESHMLFIYVCTRC